MSVCQLNVATVTFRMYKLTREVVSYLCQAAESKLLADRKYPRFCFKNKSLTFHKFDNVTIWKFRIWEFLCMVLIDVYPVGNLMNECPLFNKRILCLSHTHTLIINIALLLMVHGKNVYH